MTVKSSVVNTNNHLNGIFPSFNSLNKEFHSENRLVAFFSNCFSFHKVDYSSEERKSYFCSHLDNIMFTASSNPTTVIVVSDASIKNYVAMFITHIHSFNNPLKKTLHHTINIISTEVELFAIRCGIYQAIQIPGIIIIIKTLHAAQKIFDSLLHPYQIQSVAIAKELWNFFNKQSTNSVEFWDCLSNKDWHFHAIVDKKFDFIPLYLNKTLWDFSKKKEYDNIIRDWWENFKSSNLKRRSFLNLLNNDHLDIMSSYTKGELWIKNFGFSNTLYTWATRAITNHASNGEYQLCFFPRENFSCPCRSYPIKTRHHILYDCRKFKKNWNLGRETISQFISFLEYNLNEYMILLWLYFSFLFCFLLFFLFFSFLFSSLVSVLFNVAML